jgi:hypothetical protein
VSIPQLNPATMKEIDRQFPGFEQWYNLLMAFLRTKFDTQGYVRLVTAGTGIYAVSPNGTKYKATVSNAGAWVIAPE